MIFIIHNAGHIDFTKIENEYWLKIRLIGW